MYSLVSINFIVFEKKRLFIHFTIFYGGNHLKFHRGFKSSNWWSIFPKRNKSFYFFKKMLPIRKNFGSGLFEINSDLYFVNISLSVISNS
jgi:hypothetical protein